MLDELLINTRFERAAKWWCCEPLLLHWTDSTAKPLALLENQKLPQQGGAPCCVAEDT